MNHASKLPDSPAPTGLVDETTAEVRYGETDQMGYAHHSTPVLWFELGRVDWLRKRGLSYRELEAGGILLPVVNLSMRYHAPGRFEDSLVVQTTLIDLGKSRVTFENCILRQHQNHRTILVTGTVELACIDRNGRVQRVPPSFKEIWEKAHRHVAP